MSSLLMSGSKATAGICYNPVMALTNLQREILRLLATGLRPAQVQRTLGLARRSNYVSTTAHSPEGRALLERLHDIRDTETMRAAALLPFIQAGIWKPKL